MQHCSGCNRIAQLQIKHSELFICIPCSKLLPGMKTTRVVGPSYCPECDEPMWHGQSYCSVCIEETIHALHQLVGLETLDNNPFVYELLLPSVRFHQGAHLHEPYDCPRSEFWADVRCGDQTLHITFESLLRETDNMLTRLPPRKCYCCDKRETEAQLYICDSFEEEIIWCEDCRQVMARWLTKEGLTDHPIVKMLLMTDDSGSEFDVWYPSIGGASNSYSSTKFRVTQDNQK